MFYRVNDLAQNPVFKNLNIQSTLQQLNLSYIDILRNILKRGNEQPGQRGIGQSIPSLIIH